MKIGVFTITKCIFARYFLLIGNNSQLKVSGKATQPEGPIHLNFQKMKKKKLRKDLMKSMIQMIDGSTIHNTD